MSAGRVFERLIRDPVAFFAESQHVSRVRSQLDAARKLLEASIASTRVFRYFDLDAGRALMNASAHFLYLPWIAEHGNALITAIDPEGELTQPWRLFRNPGDPMRRGRINKLVRNHPDVYRRILLETLEPLRGRIAGMLFTLDWVAPMRQAVYVCRELGIPTVLVPHEAIFADPALYYVDRLTGADHPVCDLVLCWGDLQRDLFRARGYPLEGLRVVGSPKLDAAVKHVPALSREQFAATYGLDPARPIVLFAMQPLDSQVDEADARKATNDVVSDLLALCAGQGAQLLVRYPPGGRNLLEPAVVQRLTRARHAARDEGAPYRTEPRESIYHSRVVLSINSTMLLEACLMGRSAISTRYLAFPNLWEEAELPCASDRGELAKKLGRALEGPLGESERGRRWLEHAFSTGTFDGQSSARIRGVLRDVCEHGLERITPASHYEHLFRDRHATHPLGVAALHRVPTRGMEHVDAMLGYRKLLHAPTLSEAQNVNVFVKWSIARTPQKDEQDRLAEQLGRPQLIIEDGFLRSVDIGLSGSPALSIIVDTETAYYDATRPSRLEQRLNGGVELSAEQAQRARHCMSEIRKHRLSKFNHAPDTRRSYGSAPRVLVVDQRAGDMSVLSGLANEASFDRMLADALSERPGRTVLVKRHPDATRGGKVSYFSDERLERLRGDPRVVLIDEDVNPHTLFDQVEEVFVATSGMGMDALIAGRRVRCYGAPFYAGWGLTDDRIAVPRRTRRRSLEDVFHFAYVESSRYYAPERAAAGEIEDVIAHLAASAGRAQQALAHERPRGTDGAGAGGS